MNFPDFCRLIVITIFTLSMGYMESAALDFTYPRFGSYYPDINGLS